MDREEEKKKEDEEVMRVVREIVDKGCDAEIRKGKTGELNVIEIKKIKRSDKRVSD